MRSLSLLVLAACANPNSGVAVERVDPDHVDVGVMTPVTIEGTFKRVSSNLDQGNSTIGLVTAAVDTMPLGDATWLDEARITATMPGLPEGIYDVTVTIDGRSATLSGGYIVGNPPVTDAGTDGSMLGPRTHEVIINGPITGAPHNDFPLLVDIVDNKLRTTVNGGEVAHPQGFDISFSSDAANTVPLAHEIEKFDGSNGELVAWVKIPTLDANAKLFVHVGDPTIVSSLENAPAVWVNEFGGVYHLLVTSDSTGNAHNGDDAATTSEPNGQIEDARRFNGSTSRLTITQNATIDNIFGSGGTVSAWVFVATAGEGGLGRIFEKSTIARMGSGDGGCSVASLFFTHEFTGGPATWCTNANTLPANKWHHVAVIYNKGSTANNPTIFIDGAAQAITRLQAPNGSSFSDAGGPLMIGNNTATDRAFDGAIDELQYVRVPRTDGWIITSHANQRDPNGFVTLGP
jgi:hypothetical protein